MTFFSENRDNEIYVRENDPLGTYITKGMAWDRASSENGYMPYSVSNINLAPLKIDHFIRW